MIVEELDFGIEAAMTPRQLAATLPKDLPKDPAKDLAKDLWHPSSINKQRKVAIGPHPGRAPPGPSSQVLTECWGQFTCLSNTL